MQVENELLAPEGRRVWGCAPAKNLENLGLLECISCILAQELGHLNRKHKSLLKLLRIQARFKFCPIQCLCFVASVSHVSCKI